LRHSWRVRCTERHENYRVFGTGTRATRGMAWQMIGCSVREPSQGGALNLLVTIVMSALGPVVIPPSRLPRAMLLLGRLSPATYAASAFRQSLLGPMTGQIVVDLAVLSGVAVVLFWLVGRTMDWRQR
jgi:ABC-2 type transport system permease protein